MNDCRHREQLIKPISIIKRNFLSEIRFLSFSLEFESVIKSKTVNIVIIMSITFFLKIIYFLDATFLS